MLRAGCGLRLGEKQWAAVLRRIDKLAARDPNREDRRYPSFFEELGRGVQRPVRVLLTGGAAAILQGVKRATFDIDILKSL
jgi:hypothetical protein